MKRKITLSKKLSLTALALSLFSASLVHAQETFTIEAESGSVSYASVSNNWPAFSGSNGLGRLNAAYGSFAQYELLGVQNEGTFDLAINYSTMNTRYLYVKINDQISTVITFDDYTGGWYGEDGVDEEGNPVPGIKTKTIQVYLEKGDNLVEIGAFEGISQDGVMTESPNIDKLTFTTSATQIAKPADQISPIIYEAEDANTLNGNSKVNSFAIFSGGKGVGDSRSSDDSYFRFNSIVAPEEGTYDLAIYYTTMSQRSLYAKVNDQAKTITKCTQLTKSWGDTPSDDPNVPSVFKKTIQVYLEQGANKLEIGAYDGWGPNIDKIELVKSGYPIAKPGLEIFAYPFDYTDNALEFTESIPTSSDNLKKLTDNDEYTTYQVTGVNSASIIAKLKYPTCLTGYAVASAKGSSASIDDWTVEYSTDGSTWTVMQTVQNTQKGILNIYKVDNAPNAATPISAQYYRLTATGNGNVEVGEWQLYGVPYITAEKNFPDEVTSLSGSLNASDDGFNRGGTWNEVFENAIDKKANTKYTVVGKTTFWLQYELYGEPEQVASYSLSIPATADYNGRNPKSWKLSAYDEETGNWVVLDTVAGVTFPVTGSTIVRNLATPATSIVYKLDVTANNGQDDVHLSQWQLFSGYEIPLSIINKGIDVNDVAVYTAKNNIIITSSADKLMKYDVYNLLGKKVISGKMTDSRTEISVPAGLYIVRVNNYSTKVIVK
ncbi:MAG: DUF6383 domain-containing protein [Dysgonomonas sp.]